MHHAHLILAREALERLQLEEVIFVPAAVSPHKLEANPTAAAVRLAMLRAAVAGEPQFTIDERELQRPPPSFTIDTVEQMARKNPDAHLFYIMGSDNLAGLGTWRRSDDLRRLVRFVILDRGTSVPAGDYEIIRRPIDISATEIRNRVASRRSIRYLVPAVVEEIIRREHLYQESTASLQKS